MEIQRFRHTRPSRQVRSEQSPKEQGPLPQEESYEGSTPLWKRALHTVFPSTRPRERQWTILYYGAGNNNLSRDLNLEMGSLRNAGSSDEIQIVAQLAREGNNGQAVRGSMAKVPVGWGAVRPKFEPEETLKADMAEKATYADFLQWGMKTYPAKHYMVIQAGHGDGHRGSIVEGNGNKLTLPEEREAHEAAPAKIDVLLKESCMGGSLEEAYENKDRVAYYVASQDVTTGNVNLHGFAQEARQLAYNGELGPRDLVQTMADNRSTKAKTFVAIDSSKLDGVGQAVAEFQGALKQGEVDRVRQVASQTASVEPDSEDLSSDSLLTRVREQKRLQYRDAIGFAEGVAETVPSLEIQAKNVAERIRDSILHQHSAPGFEEQQGLSWNISPDPGITAGADYRSLAFSQDTGWTGVVES